MTMNPQVSRNGQTLTARVPLTFRRRGGRKLVLAPPGSKQWTPPPSARIDNALVKALARAHRWKRMIESGKYGSVTELAAAEKINQSYLCRVMRLTLLAPDIVEAILDGRQPVSFPLQNSLRLFPVEWCRQRLDLLLVG